MKLPFFALALIISSFSVMASSTSSQSIEQFCADRATLGLFEKKLAQNSENLMAFRNHGGLANGGVCWWHSRFQRNALYLTIYKPTETKPSQKEAAAIVSKIRAGEGIVEIPGYRNFYDFTAYNSGVIQDELEKWQKYDGITRFNWYMGLKGHSTVPAAELKKMMDELYEYVEVEGKIAYQKLQIKGIVAHAWLVVHMKKVENGYDLEVIDSNFQNRTSVYAYREDQTFFSHYAYGQFVPYLERRDELKKVEQVVQKNCNPNI